MAGTNVVGGSGPLRQPRTTAALYGAVAVVLLAVIATVALVVAPPSPPGVAEFAPQADKTIDEAPQAQQSQFGDGGDGTCVDGQACDGATSVPTTTPDGEPAPVDGATTVPTTAAPTKARVRRCVGSPPRQTEDPQSPPCVNYFEGDNGGATTRGVTRDEIRIGYGPYDQAVGDALLSYFNSRYELYGRKLVGVSYKSKACDVQGAGAAATEIAELSVFAATTRCEAQPTLRKQLASRKVISSPVRQDALTTVDLREGAPYLWNYYMPVDEVYSNFAAFACRALVGQPAVHAGGALSTRTRAFALLVEKQEAQPKAVMVDGLSRCGARPVDVLDVDQAADGTDRNVQLAVSKAQRDGATSIVCLCLTADTLIDGMAGAQQTAYQPEWLLPGLTSQENVRGTIAAHVSSQRGRVFGLTSGNRPQTPADRPSAQALTEVSGSPTGGLSRDELYHALLVIVSGIQAAGPALTPDTFQSGLEKLRFPNPGGGAAPQFQATVGFGPGDHAMTDDLAMQWLDTTRTDSEENDATSLSFCYVEQGRRYEVGTWPAGPQPFYDRRKPCR